MNGLDRHRRTLQACAHSRMGHKLAVRIVDLGEHGAETVRRTLQRLDPRSR